ncbi:uncharacterized protein LOC142549864 isoform X3 [Primulina tabacum]|uniref:uncharacterized protein LOC142549864 isoform X3 n=1 Tax=Primulina tabacum TaxID=48773 RepID=UPI003F5A33FE
MNRKRRPTARKSRTKAKKPKFLSLRLQFPAEEVVKTRRIGETRAAGASAAGSVEVITTTSPPADSESHGLNLFPLHPGNQLQDKESAQDQENVAYFFSTTDGGATSLTDLLDDSADTPSISSHTTINNSDRQDDLSPSSAYGGPESRDGSAALVRNAMKNRERDSSEEKWVCYSEVVERKKIKEEEVTSSAADPRLSDDRAAIQGLSLKLDYQEILKAWSNKGPLYVDSENSQIVPNMSDDFLLLQESSYNQVMGWACNEVKMGLWTVPEMGQREASVLRYKEKRRNRLFSKKIRYQVRKLNAEKRPRLKGRFVKRS